MPSWENLWRLIRSQRADRPGLVDEERRPTFSAALDQFEQLMLAARDVGYSARPLPLFYAVSQAARALAAAAIVDDDWQLSGHGIKRRVEGESIFDAVVFATADGKQRSTFAGLIVAVGGDSITEPTSLGRLWQSMPDLSEFEIAGVERCPRPLVFEDALHEGQPTWMHNPAGVEGVLFGTTATTRSELDAELERYPSAAGGQPQFIPLNEHDGRLVTAQGASGWLGPLVRWPVKGAHIRDFERRVDEIAPKSPFSETRVLLPKVNDSDFPHALTRWYALLHAMSMFARYEPDVWVAALHIDESPIAAALESMLDEALTAVPSWVLYALLDAHALESPAERRRRTSGSARADG
jgi:hypothetical protein